MPGAGRFADQCTDTDVNCFPKDEWVQWDALHGGWWATSDGNGGPPLDSITTYLADHPLATIIGRIINSYHATAQQPINGDGSSNWASKSKGAIPVFFKLQASSGIFGGFRVATGNGWQPFNGNANALTVGKLGDNTTYNFEGVGTLPPTQGPLAATYDLPAATIRVTKTGGTEPGGIDEPATTYQPDGGSNFRVVDCKYQYNLSIPSLRGAGNYQVEILIDGIPVGSATFDLK